MMRVHVNAENASLHRSPSTPMMHHPLDCRRNGPPLVWTRQRGCDSLAHETAYNGFHRFVLTLQSIQYHYTGLLRGTSADSGLLARQSARCCEARRWTAKPRAQEMHRYRNTLGFRMVGSAVMVHLTCTPVQQRTCVTDNSANECKTPPTSLAQGKICRGQPTQRAGEMVIRLSLRPRPRLQVALSSWSPPSVQMRSR